MGLEKTDNRIVQALIPKISFKRFVQKSTYHMSADMGGAIIQIYCASRYNNATGDILVTLSLGIRFEAVEHILANKYVDEDNPTISTPIYFLHEEPKIAEWNANDTKIVDQLVFEIETYAVPFFRTYHCLNAVLGALESNEPRRWFSLGPVGRIETLAAILALQGKKDRAFEILNHEIFVRETSGVPPRIAERQRFEQLVSRITKHEGIY